MTKTSITLAGFALMAGAALLAQQQPIVKTTSVTGSATIQAIDSTTRKITLRNDKDGEEDTFVAGPMIERFNELKVGQKVKMTYYESLVVQVRKPGDKVAPAGMEASVTRGTGAMPGATISAQERATVTVKAPDPAVPSITVTTDDGRTVTRKIEDKKNLEGIKPGDKLELTYTAALLTHVEAAK